jgi:hypothetical protein
VRHLLTRVGPCIGSERFRRPLTWRFQVRAGGSCALIRAAEWPGAVCADGEDGVAGVAGCAGFCLAPAGTGSARAWTTEQDCSRPRRHAAPGTLPPAAARDRLVQRPARSMGFCYMAHLANRRKILVPIGLALAVLIAVAVAAWLRSDAHAGGDPGGRLMAKIAPAVRLVPASSTATSGGSRSPVTPASSRLLMPSRLSLAGIAVTG